MTPNNVFLKLLGSGDGRAPDAVEDWGAYLRTMASRMAIDRLRRRRRQPRTTLSPEEVPLAEPDDPNDPTAPQRSFDLVRETLETAMPQLLSGYYPGFLRLEPEDRKKVALNPLKSSELGVRDEPPHRLDLEGCARRAPGAECSVKTAKALINCRDLPVVRRLFLVPGDDPDKTLTSFQVVRPDEGDGVLVIRTPALANGKRLEATYRITQEYRSSLGLERVQVEARVVEAK